MPGSEIDNFGYTKLGKIIKEHAVENSEDKERIVIQCSSIGKYYYSYPDTSDVIYTIRVI